MNKPADYTKTFSKEAAFAFAAIVCPMGLSGDVDDWHNFREWAVDHAFGFAYDGPATPALMSHVAEWADMESESAWMRTQAE